MPDLLKENSETIKTIANKKENNKIKPNKIFISHSSKDKPYSDALRDLLVDTGVSDNDIFYTSSDESGVAFSESFITEIKDKLLNYKTIVLIIHSHNYYKSPICLNEMGAAWVLDKKIFSFLAPGFTVDDMKGVIRNDKTVFIPIVKSTYHYIEEFIDFISEKFGIKDKPTSKKESVMHKFLSKILELC